MSKCTTTPPPSCSATTSTSTSTSIATSSSPSTVASKQGRKGKRQTVWCQAVSNPANPRSMSLISLIPCHCNHHFQEGIQSKKYMESFPLISTPLGPNLICPIISIFNMLEPQKCVIVRRMLKLIKKFGRR